MEYLIQRMLSSLFTGIIISQTGSLIQMSSRNILSSTSTLGFDGLSVLWILFIHSFLIYFGIQESFELIIFAGVPVFVLLGVFFSLFMERQKKIEKLILLGLVFNLLVGAIFSLWHFLFLAFNLPFPTELWFGHFRFSSSQTVLILILVESFMLLGWFFTLKKVRLFSLGNTVAANLNLDTKKLFLFIFISISTATFVVISLFGMFSFLGLIFPIISRKFWFSKYDIQGEFFLGSLINGLILMSIDSLCYFFPIMGAEVPVGLIATGVGALSLILILLRSDSRLEILAKTEK